MGGCGFSALQAVPVLSSNSMMRPEEYVPAGMFCPWLFCFMPQALSWVVMTPLSVKLLEQPDRLGANVVVVPPELARVIHPRL